MVEFQPWLESDALPPAMGPRDVHLWCARLDPPEPRVEELRKALAEEERQRADRFRFSKHRRRFTVARGVLRTLLGAYLELDPRDLRFVYGSKGKPRLEGEEHFHFNVSHTAELALFGFAYRELGVDVEHLREVEDARKVAERFFSPYEREVLRLLPDEQLIEAFFTCWTRKEAYVKAIGDGVPAALQDFDVSVRPGEAARVIHIEGESGGAAHWFLQELHPAPGYVGALAIRPRDFQVSAWRWPD